MTSCFDAFILVMNGHTKVCVGKKKNEKKEKLRKNIERSESISLRIVPPIFSHFVRSTAIVLYPPYRENSPMRLSPLKWTFDSWIFTISKTLG